MPTRSEPRGRRRERRDKVEARARRRRIVYSILIAIVLGALASVLALGR